MNFPFIINSIGRITIIVAVFIATILPWIFYFDETHLLHPVLLSVFLPLTVGSVFIVSTHKRHKENNLKDRYVLVSISWIVIGFFGAMPFYLSGMIPEFIDSMFESISGFTSTGASILASVEIHDKSLLYWRSLSMWIGGMGIIVLVIAIFPMFKTTGYHMFAMEMPGGVLNQKTKAKTTDIAKYIWLVYIGLTIIVTLLLMLGGVSFFDSLCHAFGTISTGGFSTKNNGIADFSPYVQYVILVFMLLSGMNFTLHYFAVKGNFKKHFHNSELRAYFGIILTVSIVITFILFLNQNYSIENAFRDAFFQVVSVVTTTGYFTVDYLKFPVYIWVFIFMLMFVGGCVGSTSGGIKIIRHVVALKYIAKYFKKLIHPSAVKAIRINKTTISDTQSVAMLNFVMLYFMVFAAGVFFMSFSGLDLETAMGSVIASIGTIGSGIGTVGPSSNFAHIPDAGKILLSILMIIGRLEIFTFLIILTPEFWKKQISN